MNPDYKCEKYSWQFMKGDTSAAGAFLFILMLISCDSKVETRSELAGLTERLVPVDLRKGVSFSPDSVRAFFIDGQPAEPIRELNRQVPAQLFGYSEEDIRILVFHSAYSEPEPETTGRRPVRGKAFDVHTDGFRPWIGRVVLLGHLAQESVRSDVHRELIKRLTAHENSSRLLYYIGRSEGEEGNSSQGSSYLESENRVDSALRDWVDTKAEENGNTFLLIIGTDGRTRYFQEGGNIRADRLEGLIKKELGRLERLE